MYSPHGNRRDGIRNVQLNIFHNTSLYLSASDCVTQNGFIKAPVEMSSDRRRALNRDRYNSMMRPCGSPDTSLIDGWNKGESDKYMIFSGIKIMLMGIVGIISGRRVLLSPDIY